MHFYHTWLERYYLTVWVFRKIAIFWPIAAVGLLAEMALGGLPQDSWPTDLIFFVMPLGILALMVIFGRKHPGVVHGIQHTFSPQGIATKMGPVSNFAEWGYVKSVSESANYLRVSFRSGLAWIPKQRIDAEKLVAIKDLIRANVPKNVRLK